MDAPQHVGPGEPLVSEVEVKGLPRHAELDGELSDRDLGTLDERAEFHGDASVTFPVTCQPEPSPRWFVGEADALCDKPGMADEPEARENWLPYFMDKAGVSQSALARLAETDRQQILKLRKRVQAVPKGWAERIAPHLDTTAVELTYGPGVTAPPEELDKAVPVTLAPVAGTTAAGMWLAEDYIDATLYEPVPVAMNRYPDLEHVAYKVSGPSMEGVRIFDGDYVIVVPYWHCLLYTSPSPRDS